MWNNEIKDFFSCSKAGLQYIGTALQPLERRAFRRPRTAPNAAGPLYPAASHGKKYMSYTIQKLKQNYKMQLALGKTIPQSELGFPIPLSTGNPLYDASLTEKISATAMMDESEHLARAWELMRNSSSEELEKLSRFSKGILNDFRLLGAVRAASVGREDLENQFLSSLPWGWKLSYPSAVISPASQFFTGWKKDLKFRLTEEISFPKLREVYGNLIQKAGGTAIMKYRGKIQEAMALLKYRPEGEKEKAVHNFCFYNGKGIQDIPELEPIGTFLKCRNALLSGSIPEFLNILENSPGEIPLTSYMGLLGSFRIRLKENTQPYIERLRNYAVRSATAAEAVLRLREWGTWLSDEQIELLSGKLRTSAETGIHIPFFKITKAFINSPDRIRKKLLKPLYIPMMKQFSSSTADLLGKDAVCSFFMPGNMVHSMSYLLYAVAASGMKTRLVLLYRDGTEEVQFSPDEIALHLTDEPRQFQEWLLAQIGGLASYQTYTYHYPSLAREIGKLNPADPVVLDLPFSGSREVLSALLPFEQVFNLNSLCGAPGEICMAYEYYLDFAFLSRNWHYGSWTRFSDSAAERFTEVLDRLRYFQLMAE